MQQQNNCTKCNCEVSTSSCTLMLIELTRNYIVLILKQLYIWTLNNNQTPQDSKLNVNHFLHFVSIKSLATSEEYLENSLRFGIPVYYQNKMSLYCCFFFLSKAQKVFTNNIFRSSTGKRRDHIVVLLISLFRMNALNYIRHSAWKKMICSNVYHILIKNPFKNHCRISETYSHYNYKPYWIKYTQEQTYNNVCAGKTHITYTE